MVNFRLTVTYLLTVSNLDLLCSVRQPHLSLSMSLTQVFQRLSHRFPLLMHSLIISNFPIRLLLD